MSRFMVSKTNTLLVEIIPPELWIFTDLRQASWLLQDGAYVVEDGPYLALNFSTALSPT